MSGAITARFIECGRGRVFVITRQPVAPCGRTLLIAAPFGEEMNKSRRILHELSLQLASHGMASVLADVTGTGDSDGEFGAADWQQWRTDLLGVARWAAGEGIPVTDLLGVRTGCILGAQVARELPHPLGRTVFWQPVTDGERYLTQFLRLRAAASAMSGGNETAAQLRQRLKDGETLEVAGYDLSSQLAGQLAQLRLAGQLTPALGSLTWVEVVRAEGASLGEASQQCVAAARQLGLAVQQSTVTAEPFWLASEVVTVPALLAATRDALGLAT